MFLIEFTADLECLRADRGCGEINLDLDDELDNITSLWDPLCDLLHDTGCCQFRVIAGGPDPWPTDVRRELSLLIEQTAEVLQALLSPEVPHIAIEFYEQGMERVLLFERRGDVLAVSWRSFFGGEAIPVGSVPTAALVGMLHDVVRTFVRASAVVCPAAVEHAWFVAWLQEIPSARMARDEARRLGAGG